MKKLGDRDGTEVLWKRWLLGFLCLCRPLERECVCVCDCVRQRQTLKGKLVNASVLSKDCTYCKICRCSCAIWKLA